MEASVSLSSAKYHMVGRIGQGAFSSVYRARCCTDGMNVAIKIIDLENLSSTFDDILQEVQTMRLCDHRNILKCYGSFVEGDQLWLITELMDRGSCLRVLSAAKHMGFGNGMNEDWLAYILREAASGLAYLHSQGHVHRDIKTGNILLSADGSVRLADFGVAGWMLHRGRRQETVRTFVGTPVYMAPEVMEQAGGYNARCDMWSLGITALELAKGFAPFAHLPAMRVLVLTIEGPPPSLSSYGPELGGNKQRTGEAFSNAFQDFYSRCLQKNPALRPSAADLLRHKFLQGRSPAMLVDQLLRFIPPTGGGELGKATSDGPTAVDDAGAGSSFTAEMELQIRQGMPGAAAIAIERPCGDPWTDANSESLPTQPSVLPSSAAALRTSAPCGSSWVFDSTDDNDTSRCESRASSCILSSSGVMTSSGSDIHSLRHVRLAEVTTPSNGLLPTYRLSSVGIVDGNAEVRAADPSKPSDDSTIAGPYGLGARGVRAAAEMPNDLDAFLADFEVSAASMSNNQNNVGAARGLSSHTIDLLNAPTPPLTATAQLAPSSPPSALVPLSIENKNVNAVSVVTDTEAFMDELEGIVDGDS